MNRLRRWLYCWWNGHEPLGETGYKSWYCGCCGRFLGDRGD